MRSVLFNTWALFFGFAIIFLAHGLQGTLIGVRAKIEGFSYIHIGLVITGFYIGYLSGSVLIPFLIKRVGHVRVFAALASLASIAILLHTLFLSPFNWFFIRILTGVSMAGIIIIMESWLNAKSNNDTRGKLLSVYLIITFVFNGLGNFLLNLSDPTKFNLFILVSLLLSFALIPILLSVTSAPDFSNPKKTSLKELYIISPLGFVAALMIGLAHSALFGYGAVYATSKDLSILNISFFMFLISLFGALFQWPIGYISDKIDRRVILIGSTLLAAGLCIVIVVSSYLSLFVFFILLSLYAGMSLPLYSLAIAHTNDFVEPDEIVSIAASFAILIGIGAILGPIFAATFMTLLGADGFFVYLFIVHLGLGLFGLYRMSKRDKPDDIESQYTPLPRNISPAGMEMNPNADVEN